MKISFKVDEKKVIKDYLIERNFSKKIIRDIKDNIYVNNNKKRLWEAVLYGDNLEIILDDELSNIVPVEDDLEIVYEDEYLMVVNKTKRIPVMPNHGYYTNSLANHLMAYFVKNNIKSTIHLVNRLDKDTLGLVLIAKHKLIHGILSKMNIDKKYYAVCDGIIFEDGEISLPIARGEDIKRVIGGSKDAKTVYHVIKNNVNTLLDISLLTGRTHQIRIHLSEIGHPIVGDSLYGNGGELALMSYYLGFNHPISNKYMEFSIPLTKDMEKIV